MASENHHSASSAAAASNTMSSSSNNARVDEIVLQCSDGVQLAGQSWTAASATGNSNQSSYDNPRRRILCLHGWMDNCRSFHYLAPTIIEQLNSHVDVVALDFPGHGHSSHRSLDATPAILADNVFYVAEAVKQLHWIVDNGDDSSKSDTGGDNTTAAATITNKNNNKNKFTLIGHSMGAAISCLYAAAFTEQIEQIILLEGAGPLARPTADIGKHIRRHVQQRHTGNEQIAQYGAKPLRVYPDIEKAIQARCATAKMAPGNQYLSIKAATEMVVRATEPATTTRSSTSSENDGDGAAAAVRFRHDPRLQWPSITYFTEEQNHAIYRTIGNANIPTAIITAKDGWPFEPGTIGPIEELLRPQKRVVLPTGSHHCHADPDTASSVAKEVIDFLQSYPPLS